MRQFETFSRSFKERAAEVLAVRKGDTVDHSVQDRARAFQLVGKSGELIVLSDVAGHQVAYLEPGCEVFYRLLLTLTLIGEDEFGSFAGEGLRDGVSETPLVGDTEDESRLTGQDLRHDGYFIPNSATRGR